MIDLHAHLLPGVDDGSESIEMSRRMLNQSVQQGIDKIVCTPHQNRELIRTETLRSAFERLVGETKDIPVKLYLGAEIEYYPEMIRDLSEGRLLTLNQSSFVLVEFIPGQKVNVADAVYELNLAGFRPIVAHLERYHNLTENDWFAVKENGGLIQINAGALKNRATRRRAKELLRFGLVDFIASDCHNDTERCVDFNAVRKYVSKKFPHDYERLMRKDLF